MVHEGKPIFCGNRELAKSISIKSHSSGFGVSEIKTPFAVRYQSEMSTVLGTMTYLQGMFPRSEPMDNPSPPHAANPTQHNIDAIAKLEHEALGRRTITERVSEVITSLVGNMGFLLAVPSHITIDNIDWP